MSNVEWDAAAYHRISAPQWAFGMKFLEALPLAGDEQAIDAGCGSGRLTAELLKRLPRGRVLAVDRSRAMLEKAEAELKPVFGERVSFLQADLTQLGLERAADLIFSTAALRAAQLARAPAGLRPTARLRAASFALVCLAAFCARAQEAPFDWTAWSKGKPGEAFSLNLGADLALTGGAFTLWGMTTVAGRDLGPDSCWLCDGPDNRGTPATPGNGRGSLNPIDAFFHDKLTGWPLSRKSADSLSSVITYGLAPTAALASSIFANGPDASDGAAARSSLLILESVAVSGFAGRAVKIALPRKRPFVRYGHGTDGPGPDGGTYDVNDPDAHFSFVSGHTITAASLVFSAATCAQLQGSRAAPLLWATAGTVTFLVGSLRMIAEKHYFSDVVGGAAIGAATGVLVPLLHEPGALLSNKRGEPAGHLTFSAGPDQVQLGWAGNL